jgi:hypothetical protein
MVVVVAQVVECAGGSSRTGGTGTANQGFAGGTGPGRRFRYRYSKICNLTKG